jgi:hypothetical protein
MDEEKLNQLLKTINLTLKPIERICVRCKKNFVGSKSFCSESCIILWKEEGKSDLWRKFFQFPYQPITTSYRSLFFDINYNDGYNET